jgi:hypothetical protein
MHIVLADMRGLRTLKKEVAECMGEAIGYARTRGVIRCTHLSDETVQRLQAHRIARESSAGNDVTVDVQSLEEAHAVCQEALEDIDDPFPVTSVRPPE